MKYLLSAWVFVVLISGCSVHSKDQKEQVSQPEKKKTATAKAKPAPAQSTPQDLVLNKEDVIALIESIPEIKQAQTELDSLSESTRHISMIVEEPTEQEPQFFVRVGVDGADRFETWFTFYVDPQNQQIYVQDPVLSPDEKLNLEDWRVQNAGFSGTEAL